MTMFMFVGLYPTGSKDYEDPTCILDVIVIAHVEVGESTRGTQPHKWLLEVGVFFYSARYVTHAKHDKFGKLVTLSLALDDHC